MIPRILAMLGLGGGAALAPSDDRTVFWGGIAVLVFQGLWEIAVTWYTARAQRTSAESDNKIAEQIAQDGGPLAWLKRTLRK